MAALRPVGCESQRGAERSAGVRELGGEGPAGQEVRGLQALPSALRNIPVAAEGSLQRCPPGSTLGGGHFLAVGQVGLLLGGGAQVLEGNN